MSYLHSFRSLLDACSHFSLALPPVQLNGYLSGVAAGPEPLGEQPWQEQILGTGTASEEIRELAKECVSGIRDDIRNGEYEPYLVHEPHRTPQIDTWMQGFNQAVELDEPTWREYNDAYLATGKIYVYLQSLVDPGIVEILGADPSKHKKYVKECLPYIGSALEKLYNGYREIDTEPDEPLPEYPPEELKEYNDDALMELLTSEGDLLPRSVVDECVQRQATLLPRLRGLLEEPAYYTDEYSGEPESWALLHTIYILGAMFLWVERTTSGHGRNGPRRR